MRNIGGLTQMPQRNLALQRLLLRFGQIGRHIGVDKAGCHAVDGDAPTAQLTRQRTRHAGHTGLGGGVIGLAGIARSADHAGDVDDAAKALLHQA